MSGSENPTLTTLLTSLRTCRNCADDFARTASRHTPNPIIRASSSAKICIAGQAPGIRAHDASTPFLDPSGIRLRAWMGVSDEVFYDQARIAIVPMGFCFPGHDAKRADLPPPKICAKLWRAQVFAAMPQISLLLVIGKPAQDWHMGRGPNITDRVRDWTDSRAISRKADRLFDSEIAPKQDSNAVPEGPEKIPLPHPSWRNNAWLKKNPWFEAETLPKLRERIRHFL